MVFTKHKMFAPAVLITCLLVFSASPILAQDTTSPGRLAHRCQRPENEAQRRSHPA